MSIGTRILFFVDDRMIRVPLRRFDRLYRRARSERMPEHAGRRVRCAMVYVHVVLRRPVDVVRIDYAVLPFGPDGRLDEGGRRRQDALVAEMVSRTLCGGSGPVVAIGPYLAGRQYRAEFKWEPTEQQVRSLIDLVLER